MEKGIQRGIYSIAITLLTLITPYTRGDVDIYWTFGDGFNPSDVTISPGERVFWYNVDPFGFDVTLYLQGYSPAFIENLSGVYATFDTTGKFTFSSEYGDTGSVTVGSTVNDPPVVTITNPSNNAVFYAPATFDIEVSTSDTGGDYVWWMDFYLGTSESTNFLAYDYELPYSATVTNLGTGTCTLIAIGQDTLGATGTNAITVIVTNPGPISLSAPRMVGGQFLFDVTGQTIGKTNVVQTSTNLNNWMPVKTNVAAAVSRTVTNTPSSGPYFYRVLQWP